MEQLTLHSANQQVAAAFERIAELLETQDEVPSETQVHRVRAYRQAAAFARRYRGNLALIAARGKDALVALPHIGEALASEIMELTSTGRLALLERLETQAAPERILAELPGIGEVLARRIHVALDIDSLEDLEAAAYDGRLEGVEGIGRGKLKAIRRALRERLSRRPRPTPAGQPPSVDLLLLADRAYRHRARDGKLRRIAPHRFNPHHRAWLPIMEEERDGWSLEVMYSNSARAHRLGHTSDWVVIRYRDPHGQGQCTVVTEHRGPDVGKRVIRGRELECLAYHRRHDAEDHPLHRQPPRLEAG